jgi:hypothetical protein
MVEKRKPFEHVAERLRQLRVPECIIEKHIKALVVVSDRRKNRPPPKIPTLFDLEEPISGHWRPRRINRKKKTEPVFKQHSVGA